MVQKRADPFYLSNPWRELRGRYLAAHPVCEAPHCGKPSGHVDHVLSRRKRPDLELAWSNLQACCAAHHNALTARHDGGFGNRRRPKGRLAHQGCGVDGVPRDPQHPWAR